MNENLINDQRTKIIDLRDNNIISDTNDYIYATVEVSSFIAWKYHPNQPKAKERGTAEFNLKEIFEEAVKDNPNNDIDDLKYGSIVVKDNIEGKEEFQIIDMTEQIKKKIKDKYGESALKEKEKIKEINEKILDEFKTIDKKE